MAVHQLPKTQIVYPDSDGQPIADNTKQLETIVYLYDNLCALFADREDVFVAADLLWYPMEGHPEVRSAPDVMVVIGRPKGHRGRYKQWEEQNIAPQVVFEIISPGNRYAGLVEKFRFYERHRVEEYYRYDPDLGVLNGWVRREGTLERVEEMEGWVSPRLGIRFALEDGMLVVYRPDGERFIPYVELRQRMEQEKARAEAISRELEQERQRAERLAQKLRDLGISPEEV